jgi:CelD/BcsL family acetyltransferase involved in cellulose biosynthesis
MAAVARYIDESGPWDIIHLGDLPGDFTHGRSIVEGLQESLPQSRIVYRNGYFPNSVFDIPRSFEQYLDGLSGNERSAIRRTRRRLQEHPALEIHPVGAASFEEEFTDFLQQHESWWARSGRLGFFSDWPGSAEFHREFGLKLACDGRLHFLKIEANGEPIAYNYSYRFGSRIHWFSGSRSTDSSWDAFSLGRQLHCSLVEQAIENGVSLIDGLSGHYNYKTRWGARSNQLKNITVMSPSLLSRLVVRDVASAVRLDYIFKRIWFWHLAPWIRRRLPPVQVSWLRRGQPRSFVRARFLEYATESRARDALCFGW